MILWARTVCKQKYALYVFYCEVRKSKNKNTEKFMGGKWDFNFLFSVFIVWSVNHKTAYVRHKSKTITIERQVKAFADSTIRNYMDGELGGYLCCVWRALIRRSSTI